jgi:hypothetical protein
MLIFFFVLRRKRRRSVNQGDSPQLSNSSDQPGGRRFDPSYHTSTDWKHKHRSFLEILANPSKSAKKEHGMTELINDPKSFFSPRTPPKPAFAQHQHQRNDSVETLRYTTTSERMNARDRTGSFSSGSELSFGIGPPKVGTYLKAKNATIAGTDMVSPMTARTDMTSTHRGPGGLLEAIKKMEDEDDPLDTPSTIATGALEGNSYPFPKVHTPPVEKVLTPPSRLKIAYINQDP